MNRTIRYTAGLMIAAGVSVAIAGPAMAAPERPRPFQPSVSSFQNPYNPIRTNPIRTNPIRNNPAAAYLASGNLVNTSVNVVTNVVGNGVTQIGAGQQYTIGGINTTNTTTQLGWLTGR